MVEEKCRKKRRTEKYYKERRQQKDEMAKTDSRFTSVQCIHC